MVTVETYLKKGEKFAPLVSCTSGARDPMYIEGAICLNVNGVELIGLEMWDDVNHLWEFIVELIGRVDNVGEGETYFPDQPTILRMRRVRESNDLIVEVKCHETVHARADYGEFRREILKGAQFFFERICDLMPAERASYQHVLGEIAGLHGRVN